MNENIDDRDAKIMNKLNVVDSLVKGSKNAKEFMGKYVQMVINP
jgi:hypothetical protein